MVTPPTLPSCSSRQVKRWARKNILLLLTTLAVILGIILGLGLRPLNPSAEAIIWIKLWGEMFMRMLKLIILPLVMTCLIVGVSSMEGRTCGRVGGTTLAYIMITQLLAVLIGVIFTVAIKPGDNLGDQGQINQTMFRSMSYTDLFTDFIRNMVPDNVIRATLQNDYTRKTDKVTKVILNSTLNLTEEEVKVVRSLHHRDGTNMLGIILFSLAIGIAISFNKEATKPFLNMVTALNKVIFSVMTAIIWYSPIGICSLIAGALLEVEDISEALVSMGLYVLTVASGLLLYMIVILPLLLSLLLRMNVWAQIPIFFSAILAGFAPPSSAGGLPYLLKDGVGKAGGHPLIVEFVAPIASTINRDGTAMFVTTTVLFLAQSYGAVLHAVDYLVLILLSTLLCTTSPAVPSSSMIIIVWLCETLAIPTKERIGLIFAVEWLNDRLRTACNTESHALAIVTVNKLCRNYVEKTLKNDDEEKGAGGKDEHEESLIIQEKINGVNGHSVDTNL